MSGAQRFEDLIAWQKARTLTAGIYQATRKSEFAKDFGLSGQIQRAAVSVMSNIAEGFGRNNPNEFHQFLVIALGSCHELRSQLYIACDVDYISQERFNNLSDQAERVANIVGALRASVERNKRNKPST